MPWYLIVELFTTSTVLASTLFADVEARWRTERIVSFVLFLSFVVDETYFKVPRHADCLKSHGRSRETISPLPHEGVENGSIAKGPREDSAWSEKLELA